MRKTLYSLGYKENVLHKQICEIIYYREKYVFVVTLTVSTEQYENVNLFKPNTPQWQKCHFMSHPP